MTLTDHRVHQACAAPDTERPVILFVDDEEGVLDGLRTSLRRVRREYELLFAIGGEEASALLADRHIDVVVTDMRMPGMNGVELLRRVRDHHPEVIRFVLSGEAGQDMVARAVSLTHRWLTKPCTREQLAAALADAVAHRGLMHDPDLGALLGGTAFLPSPPAVYSRLVSLLQDDSTSIVAVAELISGDAAIAAKVLQLANSAYSGGTPVHDIQAATVRLGLATITQLVLAVEIVRILDTGPLPGIDADVLHEHGVAVSRWATRLAPSAPALAGTVGLLSQTGLLLLAGHLPERLAAAYTHAEREGIRLVDAEQALFGMSHPEIGARLLSLWGLPTELVLGVARSHRPPGDRNGDPSEVEAAVRAARLLAQRDLGPRVGGPYRDPVDDDVARTLDAMAASVTEEAS